MTTKCLVFIGYLFICYITLSSFLRTPTAEIVVNTHAKGEHILHPALTRDLFVLEGEGTVNGIKVNTRDGIGIWNTNTVSINASSNMKFLLMDVPMN